MSEAANCGGLAISHLSQEILIAAVRFALAILHGVARRASVVRAVASTVVVAVAPVVTRLVVVALDIAGPIGRAATARRNSPAAAPAQMHLLGLLFEHGETKKAANWGGLSDKLHTDPIAVSPGHTAGAFKLGGWDH